MSLSRIGARERTTDGKYYLHNYVTDTIRLGVVDWGWGAYFTRWDCMWGVEEGEGLWAFFNMLAEGVRHISSTQ